MANYYLIRLSVHPYIRKYLCSHYSEPLFVSKRGHIPSFINNVLEPMPKLSPEEIKSVIKINYGAYFGFAVTASSARSQTYLNSDSVKKINQVISDIIHEEMYRMITRQAGKFVQVDQTIREFTAMYDFTEDELPFENLKRWYYRERKERELRRQKLEASGPQFILTLTEERKSDECIVRKLAS